MRTRIAQLFLLLMLAFPVLADEAEDAARLEQERQEAFRSGFAIIVESLNLGTFELFTSAVDRDNFFDLVFGLRLIDQEVKKSFIERVQQGFNNLSDKKNVVVKFVGFTDDDPLSGRTERIYGDHVGLSKARAHLGF